MQHIALRKAVKLPKSEFSSARPETVPIASHLASQHIAQAAWTLIDPVFRGRFVAFRFSVAKERYKFADFMLSSAMSRVSGAAPIDGCAVVEAENRDGEKCYEILLQIPTGWSPAAMRVEIQNAFAQSDHCAVSHLAYIDTGDAWVARLLRLACPTEKKKAQLTFTGVVPDYWLPAKGLVKRSTSPNLALKNSRGSIAPEPRHAPLN